MGARDVEFFTTAVTQPAFWLAVTEIMWINILLSGDNAVVIALACRELPPRERFWGMVIGAATASVLRIAFTGIVALLMTLPYLQLAGSLTLLWIAIRLLAPPAHSEEGSSDAAKNLWRAVQIVAVADIVMSLDNVIAVAAVAKGNYVLLAIGLATSIPMVVAGSALILAVLERLPILVWGGAGFLGWVAGDIFADDPVTGRVLARFSPEDVELAAKIIGASVVVTAGAVWRYTHRAAASEV
jgi:YjbE family integral membrane protein